MELGSLREEVPMPAAPKQVVGCFIFENFPAVESRGSRPQAEARWQDQDDIRPVLAFLAAIGVTTGILWLLGL